MGSSKKSVDTEKLLADLKAEMLKRNPDLEGQLQIPPACFTNMQVRFEGYEPKQSLLISLPVLDVQTNPAGFMQGGYIAAAFDNAFGPFSFLVAKGPTASIDLNVQYIRPVKTGQQIFVKARLLARGRKTLAMSGEMRDKKGRLLAAAQTNLLILA